MKQIKEELFETLRKVHNKPNSSQRLLAEELGFSLGKLNYCLRALKNKGLIKINNFKSNKNKLNYVYVLYPWYFRENQAYLKFYERKMKEYDELQRELKKK